VRFAAVHRCALRMTDTPVAQQPAATACRSSALFRQRQRTMEATMADLLHHYPASFRANPHVDADVPPRIYWIAMAGIAVVLIGLAFAVSGPVPEAMFDPNVLSPPALPFVPLL
jgi:hypothetical protein